MKWRGVLLHMTHYDPWWMAQKKKEKRFDRDTMNACLDAAAEAGMSFVVIDIKDAVRYKHFPELAKPYSVPMKELKALFARGCKLGLEMIPKLNFSKSPQHRHSLWLGISQRKPDTAGDWKRYLTAVDELLAATNAKYVHVGMDEDCARSPEEYKNTCKRLQRELKKRRRRMMMWAEVGHNWRPQERWKEIPAIKELPRDVILMPWWYEQAHDEWVGRLKKWGFDVIGTCGYVRRAAKQKGDPIENAREWAQSIEKHRAAGVILTQWIPTSKKNRKVLVEGIRRCGALFSGQKVPRRK